MKNFTAEYTDFVEDTKNALNIAERINDIVPVAETTIKEFLSADSNPGHRTLGRAYMIQHSEEDFRDGKTRLDVTLYTGAVTNEDYDEIVRTVGDGLPEDCVENGFGYDDVSFGGDDSTVSIDFGDVSLRFYFSRG